MISLSEQYSATGSADISVDAAGTFTVSTGAETVGEGITFTFDGAAKDWSSARCLAFTLQANGAHRLRFLLTHGQGTWGFYLIPRPGLLSRVVVPILDLLQRPHNRSHAGYSTFGGGPQPVALPEVQSLTITFSQVSPQEKSFTLREFRLSDDELEPLVLNPSIVVDEYGQWIGEKAAPRTPEQLAAIWSAETTEFSGFPGQTAQTGAFAEPEREKEGTGFFRVDQIDGRWLLRDPDGYPFFSIGCDCVSPGSSGPASGEGREALFADLAGAEKRSDGSLWADFHAQNLKRRYESHGDDWPLPWSHQCRTRLRRWGFNTIGNWSHPALGLRQLMPYVTNISSLNGMCARLPDVLAPVSRKQYVL